MGPVLELEAAEYERIRSALARALRRACPAWLDSRRDDLVQVAMLRVLDALKRSEEKPTLHPSYLYRAAYTAMVDEIRRAQWRREVPLERDGERAVEPMEKAHAGPERRLLAREIADAIRACLARLAAPRCLAVTLHLQGCSVGEAARTLGWSDKRTENLVYRGLADLRACLASKGVKP